LHSPTPHPRTQHMADEGPQLDPAFREAFLHYTKAIASEEAAKLDCVITPEAIAAIADVRPIRHTTHTLRRVLHGLAHFR